MLWSKRCPRCHQYVEYHGLSESMYCMYYGREEELIYHFNYDEVMGELR